MAQQSAALAVPAALPKRKELRAQGLLGPGKVKITGVLAQGTAPADHLSWDTTSLPIIARPRAKG